MQKAAVAQAGKQTALQILQYIDNNKGRQLQNQDYAAAFGMTYRRLNAIFQAVYGVTINRCRDPAGGAGQAYAQFWPHHFRNQCGLRV